MLKKIIITVPTLTKGSGLSRYVLNLAQILYPYFKISILTTHDNPDNQFAIEVLNNISPSIRFKSMSSSNKISKYLNTISFLRHENPDILINNYDGLIQYILSFLPSKTKVIHVLHNDTDDFYRIGAINAKRTNIWIAPTVAIKNRFNDYTDIKFDKKTKVIPHGVNKGFNHFKQSKKLEILYAGVLYEHKGVKELPLIIKSLLNKNIDLHFTIIGGGILEDWLKEEFKEEIAKNIVTLTGVIDHDEVYRKMSEADIFLYPTHLDSFGLVIAEAMINGAVPVVTHLKGITDELIEDGKTGYLVPQSDIDTFVNVITDLAKDLSKSKEISETAQISAREKFSLDKMKSNYIELINSL